MAKKPNYDFSNFLDTGFENALSGLRDTAAEIAPSDEEVELVREAKGEVKELAVSDLREYHNHTYRVLDNEDMDALVDSIKDMGIILPLLVRRKTDNEYEIVSGHRRLFAARKLGLETVPCKIIEADDATADIMMVDTNLHREEILPSEKAKSYEVRINAMKAKGLIKEDESDRSLEKKLADDVNSSRGSIIRYRKLLSLEPELLERVDSKEIPVVAGSKLANLSREEQQMLLKCLDVTTKGITAETADKLCTAAAGKNFDEERIMAIIDGKLKPRKTGPSLTKAKDAKEKNFASAYPPAIKDLNGQQKEEFIRDCINAFVEANDVWKDIPLGKN